MTYSLKLDLPNSSKGAVVSIPGLGEFENGHTHNIDEDAHRRFRDAMGHTEDVLNDEGDLIGYTWVQGPEITEATLPPGVTVTVKGAKKASNDEKKEGDK